MYDHYDMDQKISLDLYNEVLHEIDSLKQERDELEEDNKHLTMKIETLNNIIKELYKELKRADVKNIQEN